jgi:hypothetical protein
LLSSHFILAQSQVTSSSFQKVHPGLWVHRCLLVFAVMPSLSYALPTNHKGFSEQLAITVMKYRGTWRLSFRNMQLSLIKLFEATAQMLPLDHSYLGRLVLSTSEGVHLFREQDYLTCEDRPMLPGCQISCQESHRVPDPKGGRCDVLMGRLEP